MDVVAGLQPGTMLGKYQVLRHLATGGMAEIFLARTIGMEGFERYVVVKCIKPEFAANSSFVDMFLDEARISAQLHHHHIAQVFDMGVEEGVLYFAMEYVHGQNVQAIVQAVSILGGFVPFDHALSIVIGAAAGLGYAHDKLGSDGRSLELVHRDVTPTNILVSYGGAVKVVDFGIVKAATRSTHTRSGVLKGKIAYMSPEQCRNAPLDRRSDVFALGILLYELTTTKRLFDTESDYGTMNRIVTGEVPAPQKYRSDYPDELADIVLRCLAVKPEDRYETADALVEDLLRFAQRAMLTPTNVGLARYMTELFGKPTEPWIGLAPPSPTPPPGESSRSNRIAAAEPVSSGELIRPAPPSSGELAPVRKRRLPAITAAIAVVAIGVAAAVWIGTREPDLAPITTTTAPVVAPTKELPVVAEPKPQAAPPSTTPAPAAIEAAPIEPAPIEPAPIEKPTARDREPKPPRTTVRARPDRRTKPPSPPPSGEGSGSGTSKLRDATMLTPPD